MSGYTNADLEKLLGVRGHVIRYWEKEVPLIQPRRDHHGKFYYSERDAQLLLRLKHLLYERRFTVAGAREQLFREVTGSGQDFRAEIAALRSELIKVYFLNKREDPAPP